ncbi:T9SS type A sorting domain-containing protein [Chryseobacterium taihuense]|uniref:Por secretion system C-terminal sorting domain-containing protein n=1 Tax=Chryseobacterium taihuense TaxID=1141221 RepID=A0ABY0R3F5_9FLAO|nr:T9SS type A sorting domain-containing protein [Chryseobacterium taihuense]SDM36228.1 Por secretion system C-terminal sorting domain-containing protein [Chryseobacterium taihuense]
MKKIFTILGVSSMLMMNAQLMYEPFNNTGSLAGQNGWATHSGTTPGQIASVTGSLNFTGLAASTGNSIAISSSNTEDVNKGFTAQTSGIVYYSAIVSAQNTTGTTANTATGDYFLHFGTYSTGTNPQLSLFQARVYVKKGVAADTVNFGILNNSGGTAAPTYSATDYPINTPVFLVVKYDIATNTASLFLNPTPGSNEPSTASAVNSTGTTASPTQVDYICIRQGSSTGNFQIDEMRVGTNFGQVAPASGSLAVSDFNKTKSSFVKNTFIKNDEISFGSEVKDVKVYTLSGQLVKTSSVKANETLNIAELAKGNYIVTGTVNNQPVSQKILKD